MNSLQKKALSMCNCKDIEMGTYKNAIPMLFPFNIKWVDIDKCLASEIGELWQLGIETSGCCCGHNKVPPMINVQPEFHNKMIKLGYDFWVNEFNTYCYKPKSV